MTEETEQDIVKRIHRISTQIENIKATQLNTEQLTAVIRSANAQVRHITRQQNELSTDEFLQACEMIKDTAEKLDYWESRYKLVLTIMEEWDKDFIQLKADYEMLSEADGKTNKDAEYWKQKCIDINNDYIQINKTLKESNNMLNKLRIDYANLQAEHAELTDESKVNAAVSDTTVAGLKAEIQCLHDVLANTQNECNFKQKAIEQLSEELSRTREVCEQKSRKIRDYETTLSNPNEHECCGYSDQLIDYYRHELNRRAVKLNEREYEYKAVVKNLEKVNAECEAWKEKYNVTKKLLDAETSAEHTGSDSYNELYKENQQLYAALDEKEDQIDGLFKEAKLLTETKTSLVSELLDLKYLIHKLRLDAETSENVANTDDTDESES